ncbi:hypothetical protein HZB78_00350 [Candidatus Collierbacteria bacterium]|nr:hypothetical protein [Candidatus Collierbacteria bacterium]
MPEAFQYTLPELTDQPDIVRIKLCRPGEPLIPLSSSRLEIITHAMEHPEIPIEQFSQPSTDRKIAIEAGRLLHLAVELIDINSSVQPAQTHEVAQLHHHNLVKLAARMAPTEKKQPVRLALALLDDSQLAHPNLHSARDIFAPAHKSIAMNIAARVVHHARENSPFTVNLPLPETEIGEENDDFALEWDKRNMDQTIFNAVALLMDQRQSQTIVSSDYGPGGSLSEPRLNTLLFRDRTSFSAAPDNLVKVNMPDNERFVKITDYKTGRKFFPITEAGQIAMKASLHLLAQMGLALPDKIKPAGTSIKVKVGDIRVIKPHDHVEIKHIILSEPPQIINPLEELKIDLHDPRQASRLDSDFADLINTIRHDERLKPLLEKRKLLRK